MSFIYNLEDNEDIISKQTCVSPVMIFHGRGCEERIMACRPGTFKWLFACVKLHVVIQGPFLSKASVAEVAGKFPE